MARTKTRPHRKNTGGRYNDLRKKRLSDLASEPTLTGLDKIKKQIVRMTSGKLKIRLLRAEMINVYDKKSKKSCFDKMQIMCHRSVEEHYKL